MQKVKTKCFAPNSFPEIMPQSVLSGFILVNALTHKTAVYNSMLNFYIFFVSCFIFRSDMFSSLLKNLLFNLSLSYHFHLKFVFFKVKSFCFSVAFRSKMHVDIIRNTIYMNVRGFFIKYEKHIR